MSKIKISELLKIKYPLVLASQSPRRRNLLEQLGFEFQIIPADINENIDKNVEPIEYARELARSKALHVAGMVAEPSIVIGADTIVVIDGKILNKPDDEDDAVRMLQTLSGRTHTVFTGVAIVFSGSSKYRCKVQETDVSFRKLEYDEIITYVNSGSPMDKAGSYGIQDDFGAVFVNHIEGCYYNIVGLPLEMLYSELKEFACEIE